MTIRKKYVDIIDKPCVLNKINLYRLLLTATIYYKDLMKMQSCFLSVLKGQKIDRIPIWFMRQAGRSLPEYRKYGENYKSLMDKFLCPEAICEITLQPLRRFDIDVAILFSDILIIPYALGQGVHFEYKKGPILSELCMEKLNFDCFESRIKPILDGIQLIISNLPVDKALLGFVGSPWTLATYMIGNSGKNFNDTIQFSLSYPDVFKKLMDILTEACIYFLKRQIESGVMAVQLFDSWAGSVPEFMMDICVLKPLIQMTTALKEKFPHIPIISFPKGVGYRLKNIAEISSVDALSFDSSVPLGIIKKFQDQKITQGNLDPNILWAGGLLLEKSVDQILSNLCNSSRHIFNLGHGVLPTTPINNIEQTIARIRS